MRAVITWSQLCVLLIPTPKKFPESNPQRKPSSNHGFIFRHKKKKKWGGGGGRNGKCLGLTNGECGEACDCLQICERLHSEKGGETVFCGPRDEIKTNSLESSKRQI